MSAMMQASATSAGLAELLTPPPQFQSSSTSSRLAELEHENALLRTRLTATIHEMARGVGRSSGGSVGGSGEPGASSHHPARAPSIEVHFVEDSTPDPVAGETSITAPATLQQAMRLRSGSASRDDRPAISKVSSPSSNASRGRTGSLLKSATATPLHDGLRNELAQALAEIETLKATNSALTRAAESSQRPSYLDDGVCGPAGNSGDEDDEDAIHAIKAAFRVYGKVFSVDEVKRLLELDEDTEVRQRMMKDEQSAGGTDAHVAQTLRMNAQLREDLATAQEDLLQAHKKIEELTFTLEIYSEKNELRYTKSVDHANSESAKHAAHEIAFLCDTLAATRSESEQLAMQVTLITEERNAAVAAFAELQAKSLTLLQGCEEMTSTAQEEASASILAAQSQVRDRERDLSLLRGQMLSVTRMLDEQRQLRVGLESELVECRSKMTSIKDTCAALRSETKNVKVEKQALLAQITQLTKQAADAQEKARSLEFQLSAAKAAAIADGARNRRHAAVTSASPGRASPKADDDERDAGQPHARSNAPATASGKKKTTPAGRRKKDKGPDALDSVNYEQEYEELKRCFLLLLPLVPGAVTADDVAVGLKAWTEKLHVQVKALEAELRKRHNMIQQLRQAQNELLERNDLLEKKAGHLHSLEKKLEAKDRLLDKLKRDVALQREEGATKGKSDDDVVLRLRAENESLTEELATVKRELEEGKEVMIRLIREGMSVC